MYEGRLLAFRFATAETTDSISGNTVLPLDHLIETLVSQFCIKSPMYDGEEVLNVLSA